MKRIILSASVMALLLVACNSNNDKTTQSTETTMMDTTTNPAVMHHEAEQLYACSMHPEVIGKKDEKCSKCGMKLTVPVKSAETPK